MRINIVIIIIGFIDNGFLIKRDELLQALYIVVVLGTNIALSVINAQNMLDMHIGVLVRKRSGKV